MTPLFQGGHEFECILLTYVEPSHVLESDISDLANIGDKPQLAMEDKPLLNRTTLTGHPREYCEFEIRSPRSSGDHLRRGIHRPALDQAERGAGQPTGETQ